MSPNAATIHGAQLGAQVRQCAACFDYVVGPAVQCDNCGGIVHAHCMQVFGRSPVCVTCIAERDAFVAARRSTMIQHGAQQFGRALASGGQLAGQVVGATAFGLGAGVTRLASGMLAGARQTIGGVAEIPGPARPRVLPAPQRPLEHDSKDSQQMDELRLAREQIEFLTRRTEELERQLGGYATPGGASLDAGAPTGGRGLRRILNREAAAIRNVVMILRDLLAPPRRLELILGLGTQETGSQETHGGTETGELPGDRTGTLTAVLARLKDTDVPTLEWVKGVGKASTFEDWLQRASIRIGGLHPALEAFWARAQECCAVAHDEYLSLDLLRRPLIRPAAHMMPAELRNVELRLRPLLLDAMPENIRKQALATRQTAVADILFAAMVEAGPGTLKDREATLKAVERRGQQASNQVADVYESLQRWKFDLTRLQRLGMAAPDPTVQLSTLRGMVRRMSETDGSFEMQHGLSGTSCCSQAQVDEFWRYLSAEAREVCGPDVAAKSVKAKIAEYENKGKDKGKEKDKGKPKGGGTGVPPKGKGKDDKGEQSPCKFFQQEGGCRNGGQCSHPHRRLAVSEGKCFNCGAVKHKTDACPRPRREVSARSAAAGPNGPDAPPPSANVGAVVAATIRALASQGLPGAQESRAQVQAPTEEDRWLDSRAAPPRAAPGPRAATAAVVVEGGAEEAEGRRIAPQPGGVSVGETSTRAVAIAKVMVIKGKRMRLADTGETHELRSIPIGSTLEVPHRSIELQVATGSINATIGDDDIVYVPSEVELQPLFPIGAYLYECDLRLAWSAGQATIRLPSGRDMKLEQVNGALYLDEETAEQLRSLRRRLRQERGRALVLRAVAAAVSISDLARHRAEGHPRFMQECQECRLAAGRMRASYFLLAAYQVLNKREVEDQERMVKDAKRAAGFEGPAEPARGVADAGAAEERGPAGQEEVEEQDEVKTRYYTKPLEGKASKDCTAAMDEIISEVNLEFQGPAAFRLHGDKAGELTGRAVKGHMASRHHIAVTSTAGGEPNSNPRAERGVGVVKTRARAMLMAEGLNAEDRQALWPAAVPHAAWCQRREAQGRGFGNCPPFGAAVTSRIKDARGSFEPRAREQCFFGVADGVSGGFLLGRKGAAGWVFEVSSSFVLNL
ncbi:unnamed protein product, partial [Prorocentrum cordatum]